LAALSPGWLRRYFWLVSPLIDAAHLLLLYLLSFRLTDSVLAAATAGLIYAVTPQLISETRNLNGRAFASLLQTMAMVTLLRSVIPGNGPTASILRLGEADSGLYVASVVLIALLYNTHTSTTIALLVSTATLSLVFGEPRFLLAGALGLPVAIVISGGYYVRVIQNHLHAARFWLRNVHLTRAHQVDDSPVVGRSGRGPSNARGMYHGALRARLLLGVRLLGENPFIVAMLVTPVPASPWGAHMYWWAVAILGWSVLTTFGGPLRILGPGFQYMKASVFPSAYALAVTVNVQEGAYSPVGAVLLLSVLASFAALAYFYRVMARRQTEHTAQTPPDLAAAAAYLAGLSGRNVLVLPSMYADFVAYAADKAVVWGGHSGDLTRFEEFSPVIRKPLEYFFERYAVDYLVLDLAYTDPATLRVEGQVDVLREFGAIVVYAVRAADRPRAAPVSLAVPVAME
ncbi:MAG: hypothetical protein M3336_01120, partial [Chloroflexota bacterium]|nr:hypothetical protein [Chloroflexota bacterium]